MHDKIWPGLIDRGLVTCCMRITDARLRDAVRTHFTSSTVFSTAAWSERSSLTMSGGDAREKPVPTAFHSLDSENVRRTCRPSRPVAPVMSTVEGMVARMNRRRSQVSRERAIRSKHGDEDGQIMKWIGICRGIYPRLPSQCKGCTVSEFFILLLYFLVDLSRCKGFFILYGFRSIFACFPQCINAYVHFLSSTLPHSPSSRRRMQRKAFSHSLLPPVANHLPEFNIRGPKSNDSLRVMVRGNRNRSKSNICFQKLLSDPKTRKIGQGYSFQLAITRARTNPHCYAYAPALRCRAERVRGESEIIYYMTGAG